MKTSKTALRNFIRENINYKTPGAHDVYAIWESAAGKLSLTHGSMEYRDDDHTRIGVIELYNEFAPYSLKSIIPLTSDSKL